MRDPIGWTLAVVLFAFVAIDWPPAAPKIAPGFRNKPPGPSPYDYLPRTTNVTLGFVNPSLLPVAMWSRYPLRTNTVYYPYAYKHRTTGTSEWGFPPGIVEIKVLAPVPVNTVALVEYASYPFHQWYTIGRLFGPLTNATWLMGIDEDAPTGFYRVHLESRRH